MSFDTVVVVDWSARATPSPARPGADAIWIGVARGGKVACSYHRTRARAMAALTALLAEEVAAGRRVLSGFDFPFAYPKGFARALTGSDDPLAVWAELEGRIVDGPDNANNRFEAAAGINGLFPGVGPFWGCPVGFEDPRLPRLGTRRDGGPGLPDRRGCEALVPRAQPGWKLYGNGSVGSQALLGLPHLQGLRARFGPDLAVRPFEDRAAPIVLAEVFPSLIAPTIAALAEPDEIRDRAQVRVLAGALAALDPHVLDGLLTEGDPEEGWILGLGHETALDAAARRAVLDLGLVPPRLKDDCFAMPQGVAWVSVDDALARLKDGLVPLSGEEAVPLARGLGRVLARDIIARRSNPPAANAAVDGYGFAADATADGPQHLPLIAGRAAAGQPFAGRVPAGAALRILTGAILPEGVDTVVLQEDTATDGKTLAFDGPVRKGANTRRAGEDLETGALALASGHLLRPPDLALLAAVGHDAVTVRRRLRVAVLSTGDELADAGTALADAHRIPDANRPMLLALADRWGYLPVDLGRAPDDAGQIAARLDRGAAEADVILTTGGASTGDEDHVSRLLRERGRLTSWRIAVKPGRPLALAMWQGVPVFGLPGNPVAAFVCSLIFARPALAAMSGAGWTQPQGFTVPAAFSKSKAAGRREYLRARLTTEGSAEVFRSEGSGRISGLSWAEGLVELPDGPAKIAPGTPVRFLPYSGFGL